MLQYETIFVTDPNLTDEDVDVIIKLVDQLTVAAGGKVIKTEREYPDPHPFADVVTALDYFKESPLLFEPGTKYSYTTHGFMLLGAAAERAGKQRFADQVKKRIAEPCAMVSSTLWFDFTP